DLELILYLMAKAERESLRKAFSRYMTKLRHTQTILKGADLKKLGAQQGPVMGEILRELLRKRLDNEVVSREDEEAFVKAFLKKKTGRKKLK
ncbi:partial A-adding tRNA nucleotidyltransferase, partial [Methylophilaceae bacterium]